jgi:hypothetical protein
MTRHNLAELIRFHGFSEQSHILTFLDSFGFRLFDLLVRYLPQKQMFHVKYAA